MAETDAAFELRRAADTLERLAKATHREYEVPWGEYAWQPHNPEDSAFIRAMSPEVALALADTLRILEDPTLEALLKVEHNLRELARMVNSETGDGA